MSSKTRLLKKKLEEAKKQYEASVAEEQSKVGALVIGLYEKKLITDSSLITQIAKIIGDDESPKPKESYDNNSNNNVREHR